jgi:hypothetical protein
MMTTDLDPPPTGDLTSEPVTFPAQVEAKEQGFCTAFLENPRFLPYGGMLGFGLRHLYQVQGGRALEHVYGLLKGSDVHVRPNGRTSHRSL